MSGFQTSSRFVQTAATINNIPSDKFPSLVERILKKLHLKNAKLFSNEEEEGLKELLGLSTQELKMVLDCICYTFEQAAFTSTGPEALYEILLNAGFEDGHAKIVGRTWAAEASDYVAKLKNQRLGFQSLTSVDYHLNMVVGQDDLTRQQEPVALFELGISAQPDKAVPSTEQQREEKFCMELNHKDLFDLFLQLERMQQQLDGLGKQS
mmetsp:Transcript_25423/g.27794  ORF Transcript_25423/g.27794 Transcript_25423/m.27794 type:complete len:209 (+) Transcript_25423:57-683(+)